MTRVGDAGMEQRRLAGLITRRTQPGSTPGPATTLPGELLRFALCLLALIGYGLAAALLVGG